MSESPHDHRSPGRPPMNAGNSGAWLAPQVSDEWTPVADARTPPTAWPPGASVPGAPVPGGEQPGWGTALTDPALTGPTPTGSPRGEWPRPPRPASGLDAVRTIFSMVSGAPRVFVGLVGISWLVVGVPAGLLGGVMLVVARTFDAPAGPTSSLLSAAVTAGISFVMWAVAAGTLTGVAAHPVSRLMGGASPGLLDTWQHTRAALPRLIGWSVLLGAAVASASAPGVAMVMWGLEALEFGLLAVGALLLVLALVPIAWLGVRTVHTAPAIVMEGLSIPEALRRSAMLTVRRFWATFGVLALMAALAWVTTTTLMYPAEVAVSLGRSMFDVSSGTLEAVASTLSTVIASLIVAPVLIVVPAVLHADALVRERHLGGAGAR